MAGTYQKLEIKRFAARAQRETAEGRYWRAFQAPVAVQQAGAVTNIDFMPNAPYHLAATASTRVRDAFPYSLYMVMRATSFA